MIYPLFIDAKEVLMIHAMVVNGGWQASDTWCFSFGEFVLHEARRELTRHGTPVSIGGRAMDVLLAVLRRAGRVASKEEIIRDAWDGMSVAQNNLTTQMAHVRRALDDAHGRRFIQTVPARGYRFVAEVAARPTEQATTERATTEQAATNHAASEHAAIVERHRLLADSSSFIPEREPGESAERPARPPLVAIIGAGGAGKARIALRCSASQLDTCKNGVLLLELAPLTDPSLVAEALCRKLGAPKPSDRSPIESATLLLRGSDLLLVLDNAAHILVTRSEPTYPLPPPPTLPIAEPLTAAPVMRGEAMRLFAGRAGDAFGSYALSTHAAPGAATVCRGLDGLRILGARELPQLEHAALAFALAGALEVAASLLGFTDAHYRAAGHTRERQEQVGYDRLHTILQVRLPPHHLAALRAIGAAWSPQTADAAALSYQRNDIDVPLVG